MKAKFTTQAEIDIIESYVYGALTFGRDQAEGYEQDLRHAIGLIADNPRMAAERPEYEPPVRVHHHARHFIIYLVEEDGVLIVRVLRDSMDLTRHLPTKNE